MRWVLATTHTIKKFYIFDPRAIKPGEYQFIDVLDESKIPGAADKKTAKEWALKLGLSTWSYVRFK